jgi:hypothetical protein
MAVPMYCQTTLWGGWVQHLMDPRHEWPVLACQISWNGTRSQA